MDSVPAEIIRLVGGARHGPILRNCMEHSQLPEIKQVMTNLDKPA